MQDDVMRSEAVSANASAGKLWYLFIIAVVLAFDQFTKYLVSVKMTEADPGKEVIRGLFRVRYTENEGIAFGMLSNNDVRWVLVAVSIAAILTVVYYMMRTPIKNRLLLWSLALLAAGIGGNLVDRIRLGRVIDFIEIYFRSYSWPVFNMADTAITVGAALMAIELFFASQAEKATAADGGESSFSEGRESGVRGQESD